MVILISILQFGSIIIMLSRSPVVAAVVKILISSSNVHQSNAEIEKNLISTYSKDNQDVFLDLQPPKLSGNKDLSFF